MTPLIGIPACQRIKTPGPIHHVGEKYVNAVVHGVKGLPVLIPACGEELDLDELITLLDGLLLTGGGDASAIDAAARLVCDERRPEIAAVQQMQTEQARLLFSPGRRGARVVNRLLPFLVRTGLFQWLQRKQYRQMSDGAVPVRLLV